MKHRLAWIGFATSALLGSVACSSSGGAPAGFASEGAGSAPSSDDGSTTGVPECDANVAIAFNWLSACGPDRSAYFAALDLACPSSDVGGLNGCKFQYCIDTGGPAFQGGPCNYF